MVQIYKNKQTIKYTKDLSVSFFVFDGQMMVKKIRQL